jgi:hypothetical protein
MLESWCEGSWDFWASWRVGERVRVGWSVEGLEGGVERG